MELEKTNTFQIIELRRRKIYLVTHRVIKLEARETILRTKYHLSDDTKIILLIGIILMYYFHFQ